MVHVGDELSALLDDELPADRAPVVTRHLADCAPCREELEQLRRTRAALRGLGAPALRPGWMVETYVAAHAPAGRGGASHPAVRAAAAAGLTLAVGVGVAFALGGGGAPGAVEPPVQRLVVDHLGQAGGGPVLRPVGLDGASAP